MDCCECKNPIENSCIINRDEFPKFNMCDECFFNVAIEGADFICLESGEIKLGAEGGDTMGIYIVKYQEPNGEVQMVEYPASKQQAMLDWIGENTWVEVHSVRLVNVVETYKVNFSAILSKK